MQRTHSASASGATSNGSRNARDDRTPNVTLDATINPDFDQVEANPAVVHLSAFETFCPEQRPFFGEGTGLYQFQLNCCVVVDCNTNEGLFYSRRIGRSPALRDLYGDNSTASTTPIAAATKLTGRTSSGLSFGLLDAFAPRVGGVRDQTVEPQTNYAVLRGPQDFRGGEGGVSLIATTVNRSLDNRTDPYLHATALDHLLRPARQRREFQRPLGAAEQDDKIPASRTRTDRGRATIATSSPCTPTIPS
ncbi:MAG: DUF5916 domain-containing protein [Gemmatimonadaceae bacterium]